MGTGWLGVRAAPVYTSKVTHSLTLQHGQDHPCCPLHNSPFCILPWACACLADAPEMVRVVLGNVGISALFLWSTSGTSQSVQEFVPLPCLLSSFLRVIWLPDQDQIQNQGGGGFRPPQFFFLAVPPAGVVSDHPSFFSGGAPQRGRS